MDMTVFRPGGPELTKKAAEFIGLKPGERVLDIGCGLGTSLSLLRDNYGIVPFGADIEPAAAEKAGELLGSDNVICADGCRLPFEDGKFHAIFCECVLSLMDEPLAALSEMARLLCPGGHLVISTLSGGSGALSDKGRICIDALSAALIARDLEVAAVFDETHALRQFVAECIFRHDSVENYIKHAGSELGGSVLGCAVPPKGTGYTLFIAKKPKKV